MMEKEREGEDVICICGVAVRLSAVNCRKEKKCLIYLIAFSSNGMSSSSVLLENGRE